MGKIIEMTTITIDYLRTKNLRFSWKMVCYIIISVIALQEERDM